MFYWVGVLLSCCGFFSGQVFHWVDVGVSLG